MFEGRAGFIYKAIRCISIIGLIVGIYLLIFSNVKEEYSVGHYWVAKDYHHVYDTYTGEIVDYISDGERCKIDGDKIIVSHRKKDLYITGIVFVSVFGFIDLIYLSLWWSSEGGREEILRLLGKEDD